MTTPPTTDDPLRALVESWKRHGDECIADGMLDIGHTWREASRRLDAALAGDAPTPAVERCGYVYSESNLNDGGPFPCNRTRGEHFAGHDFTPTPAPSPSAALVGGLHAYFDACDGGCPHDEGFGILGGKCRDAATWLARAAARVEALDGLLDATEDVPEGRWRSSGMGSTEDWYARGWQDRGTALAARARRGSEG